MSQPSSPDPSSQASARWGRWLVVAACVLWSTNGFFVKWPVFADWPAETRGLVLAVWRNVFASAALIPLVRRPRLDWRMTPMALSFTLMSVTFLSSMVDTTAANAIWLQNTAPIWILCSGLWIYREPFDRRNLAPLITGLLGAALIISCEIVYQPQATSVRGVLLGAASGFFYAIVVVSMRRLREFNSAWLIAFNHLAAVLLLAPWVLSTTPWPQGIQWPVLIAFGMVQMGIPYMLFAEGLKRIPSQEGAAIGLLEPVLVPIWVFIAWGEMTAWWTIAGGAIILVGLALRYVRRD